MFRMSYLHRVEDNNQGFQVDEIKRVVIRHRGQIEKLGEHEAEQDGEQERHLRGRNGMMRFAGGFSSARGRS